jgi:hypothetical protein
VAVRCTGFNPTRARPFLERLSNVLAVAGSVQGEFFSISGKAHCTVAVSTWCDWKTARYSAAGTQGNSFRSGQLFEMVAGDGSHPASVGVGAAEGTSILLSPAGKGVTLSRPLTQ